MKSGMGRTNDAPEDERWPKCVCEGPECRKDCEACKETGPCVPAFMRRDGPSEKDLRRDRFSRRRGAKDSNTPEELG